MAGGFARCRITQRVLLWLIHPMRVCAVHVGRYKVGMSEGFAWTSPYVYVGVVVRECGWVRVSVAGRWLTMSVCVHGTGWTGSPARDRLDRATAVYVVGRGMWCGGGGGVQVVEPRWS